MSKCIFFAVYIYNSRVAPVIQLSPDSLEYLQKNTISYAM